MNPRPTIVDETELIKKVTRDNIAIHLVQYQLRMIGKTIKDAQNNPSWYSEWTIEQVAFDEFKGYAISLMRKIFKCNKALAENNFKWFEMRYGLKIK